MSFFVRQKRVNDTVILVLSGKLDFEARHLLGEAMEEAFAQSSPQIILDLANVSFIDSAGLALLVQAHKKSSSTKSQIILAAPQPYVLDVLKLMCLDQMIPILSTPPSHDDENPAPE